MNNDEKILQVLAQMQTNMTQMQTDIAQMQTNMTQMQTTLDQHTELFHKMDARITKVEDETRATRILIEQDIDKKLSLLAEGHGLLVEKLDSMAPKSRVDALEEQVDLLKHAVRMLSQDVAELKKGA